MLQTLVAPLRVVGGGLKTKHSKAPKALGFRFMTGDKLRDPFEIFGETTSSDALDALYTLVGEGGAPRAINDLNFLGTGTMFGRAVTLRSVPSREDNNAVIAERAQNDFGMGPFQHALSLCDSESVLVIEADRTKLYAAAGGTGLASLVGRNAAGLLTDGQIRDKKSLSQRAEQTGISFVTGGFTPQYGTNRMLTPSDVNVPVAIHNVLVVPGDYIFADSDGVVVIPAAVAEEVLESAVVINRSAEVMEDLLIERSGIIGVDLTGVAGEVEEEMLRRYDFSDRQLELFRKKFPKIR